MKIIQSIVAILFLSISACNIPTPLLKSSEPGVTYILSENGHESPSDSAVVSLELLGKEDGNWIFEVSIQNNTDSLISVKPRNLFCRIHGPGPEFNSQLLPSLTEMGELRRIESERIKVNKNYRKKMNEDLILTTIDLIDDFSTPINSQTNEEELAEELDDKEREERYLASKEKFKQQKSNLEQEEMFWKTELLADSELGPGEVTTGLVVFPVLDYVGNLEVIIQFYPYRYIKKYIQQTVRVGMMF